MPHYLNLLVEGLRERAAGVWPQTIPNGIWTAEHIALIPWEVLTPPYGVISIEGAQKGDGWGAINQVMQFPVDIYYVDEVAGPMSGIVETLGLLEDDLLHNTLTSGQVIRVTALTWSDMILPNQIFLTKGMSHRAGRLTAQCIAGVIL